MLALCDAVFFSAERNFRSAWITLEYQRPEIKCKEIKDLDAPWEGELS